MKLGEIYYWETDKVQGRDSRFKYHVFICEPEWPLDYTFLFVNSADYGGDYPIRKSDYPFFANDTSYIDVGGVISYVDDELSSAKPLLKGQLTVPHMQALYHVILQSGKMPGREERIVCNALRTTL